MDASQMRIAAPLPEAQLALAYFSSDLSLLGKDLSHYQGEEKGCLSAIRGPLRKP